MVTGYRSGGVDFDDLFDPYVQGDRSILSGRRVAGVDLNQRYARIEWGSKRPDVGYRVGGTDLSNLWAAKGTAVYSLGFNGKSYTATAQAPTTGVQPPTSTLRLDILPSGNWQIVSVISNSIGDNGTTVIESGSWLPSGQSASEWTVRFNANSSSGGGTITNGATTPQPCTSTRSISITASVPAASATLMDAQMNLSCFMTRSAGGSSTSSCNFRTTAVGYL